MTWKDIRIGKKLYIGFGIVLGLTLVLGAVAWTGVGSLSIAANKAEWAGNLQSWAGEMALLEIEYRETSKNEYADRFANLADSIRNVADRIKPFLNSEQEIQNIAHLTQLEHDWTAKFERFVESEVTMTKAVETFRNAAHAAEAETDKVRGGMGLGIKVTVLQARRSEKDFMLRGDAKYIAMVKNCVDQIIADCNRNAGSEQLQAVIASMRAYQTAFEEYCTADAAQKSLRADMSSLKTEFLKAGTEFEGMQAANLSSVQTTTRAMTGIFLVIAVCFGVLVAYVIARGISRPVSRIAQVAEEIALGNIQHQIEISQKDEVGVLADSFRKLIKYMNDLAGASQRMADNDLTVDIQPKSEKDVLGNSFKTMAHNLSTMIRQLSENARELVSAATEIASSSEQMSKGAKDQSDQVTQVSTAVEEMTATILESSKNAGEASNAARNAADTATGGGRIVNDTIQGMQKIATVVRESADSIGKLARSADQIGEIIGVIDDIADQTNLLALNAAIEAARAGEQGRGFAVVADEVRKLAERTGKATGEITEMIKGIQKETADAVTSMEAGILEVDKGRELADRAGSSLNEIVNMAVRVTDMITQMATATEEQSSAAEQISKNVEHISGVTRESAAGAQQSAAAAEELNRQADGIRELVTRFRLTGGDTGILDLAKNDHRLYVEKMKAVIAGKHDVSGWKQVNHHTCRFGKWYYSQGVRDYGHLSEFKAVEAPHQLVHQLADQAILATRSGDTTAARRYGEQARTAAHEVIEHIDNLRQAALGGTRA
ncbi:hypothetical protein C3F09_08790 [candidate division GN15 bacterium]|uniref:HAMP domain-containing protein n=1 Tax=candidate division GN15 bacterium TaxID=2072418 RepID=A0A855X177_9BACT|nr:MAG: hypothetical protein C3F09_08790 [candidate division GN15 bacterium]